MFISANPCHPRSIIAVHDRPTAVKRNECAGIGSIDWSSKRQHLTHDAGPAAEVLPWVVVTTTQGSRSNLGKLCVIDS